MDDKKLYDLSEKIPFTRVTDAVLYEFYNSANNNEIKYFISLPVTFGKQLER